MELVKVESTGCQPCRILDTILKQEFGYEPDRKVNVDEDEDFKLQYDIMKAPQLLLLDEHGNVTERVLGIDNLEAIANIIKKRQEA
jgi:hypothetical protein